MPVPFFLLSLCTIVYAVTNPVMNESGQLGLKQVLSAQTLGASHLSVFFDFNFASSSNQIVRLVEPKELEIGYDTIYPKYTLCGINPAVSYGITDFLDAAVHIPFLFDIVENFTPEAGILNWTLSAEYLFHRRTSFSLPCTLQSVYQSEINLLGLFPEDSGI
jgi:hypothetical protein